MDELSIEEKFQKTIKGASLDVYRGVVKRKHIVKDWQEKKDFYYLDTGYFGNFTSPGNPGGKKLFHRIVKNDLQKHWLENHPSDRWEEICKIDSRYQWKGWKKKGNKILIVVPNRKSCIFYGYEEGKLKDRDPSKPTWLMNTVETIKNTQIWRLLLEKKVVGQHDTLIRYLMR